MGKSVCGPAMLDCLMYLRQMDDQGGWFTTVLLLPDGSVASPHVTFNILSVRSRPEILEGKGVMTIYDGYPAREHTTFNGAFYRAIVEHDKMLSSVAFDEGVKSP